MHEQAELLEAVAWPIVALIALLLLRTQITLILAKFANRIDTADKVKIGKDGLELEGRLAALEIKSNILPGSQDLPRIHPMAVQGGIPVELKTLAEQYLTVDLADYAARVLRKNHLADEMARMVSEQGVSRNLLAESGDEGLYAALATVVVAQPGPADFPLLAKVADATRRKHVQYRVVLACIELLKRQFIAPRQQAELTLLLNRLTKVDDPSLKNLVLRTEPLLNTLAV